MFIRGLIVAVLFCVAVENAHAQRTGEFILKATPSDVLGATAADYIDQNDTISWEIYVPENYNANKPAGVMVYAGAPRDIRAPGGWLSVIKDKNLIWAAARKSGDGTSIYQKVMLAMMSVPLIEKEYNIDKSRVYITGEGRTAARTALNYPDMFSGGIFVGNNIWEDNAEEKMKRVLDKRFLFAEGNSSIFFTTDAGTQNLYNRSNQYAFRKFKKSGVEGAIRLRESQNLSRRNFARVIDYLDGHNFPQRLTEY